MNRVPPLRRLRPALLLIVLLLLSLLTAATALAESDGADEADGLKPGETVTYEQTIPVNIVFVGYERADLNMGDLRDMLPGGSDPIVRVPAFYGIAGRDMGLSFTYDYSFTFANDNFTDDYFAYLASIATPGDLNLSQVWYNDNLNNILDVTGPVGYIDAPSAEGWLVSNAHRLNIDTEQAYTIYFVNWYGRDDFQFHIYTKTDEPDPDTGYNFGIERPSRKGIAWGGSHGRAWFYDLSAGPEIWTDNWYVDDVDLNGDGVEEYRMPPIWEYDANGYRDPAELGADLGRVARFVAINLLFTSSPLYDPMASSPGPSGDKFANMELFEFDRGAKRRGINFVAQDYINEQLAAFQPYYDWHFFYDDHVQVPLGARSALRIVGGRLIMDDCWNDFGTVSAQFYCYFSSDIDRYVPDHSPDDYVSTAFLYNTNDHLMGNLAGLLGFADDNWTDGTPSYVFAFLSEGIIGAGYGLSTTTVHELGHHHGMSHPHDGYDSEWDLDYGPGGEFYFAWSGDESATIMSYYDVNFDFGTFDYDNMGRYHFAGYLNWANHLLDDVQSHPDFNSVRPLVNEGKQLARQAEGAFNDWHYTDAAMYARQSFEAIGTAAEQLGIPTSRQSALRLAPNPNVPRQVDPVRRD